MDERATLMHQLQAVDFALDEMGLFLNTHPGEKEALSIYSKFLKIREQVRNEYIKKFGPIIAEDYQGGPTWDWVHNPWPWDKDWGD